MSKSTLPAGHSQSPRGRRKLDFSSKPLRGKTFFLDLPEKSVTKIEEEITLRGGVVEKFFHRGVRYLVTNRHKKNKKEPACSPLTLSPDTPEGGGRVVGYRSPVEGSKSKTVPVAYGTRAAKILANSLEKQGGKKAVDVLKVASEWKMKVLTLEELMAELMRMKLLPLQPSSDHRHKEKQYKVRGLKPPFMKVVDQSGLFRPLLYETDKWPLPNPNCPPSGCPYDTLKKNGKVTPLSRATGARLTQDLVASIPAPSCPATTSRAVRRRPGYCECCALRYEDLKMHLRSQKHRDYATNDANFAMLDAFTVEKELDYNTFMRRLRQKCAERQNQLFAASSSPPAVPLATPTQPRPKSVAAATEQHLITTSFSPKRGSLCLVPVQLSGKGSPRKQTIDGSPTRGKGSPRKQASRTSPRKHGPCTPTRGKRTPTQGKGSPRKQALCTPTKASLRKQSVPEGKGSPGKQAPCTPTRGKEQFVPGHASCTPTKPRDAGVASLTRKVFKRGRRDEQNSLPLGKRQRLKSLKVRVKDEIIPETPEKPATVVPTLTSPLYNIQSLIDRFSTVVVAAGEKLQGLSVGAADGDGTGAGEVFSAGGEGETCAANSRRKKAIPKTITNLQELLEEVTRDSPLNSSLTLSPGTSPLTRKSPRLLQRHHDCPAPQAPSQQGPLVISFPLKKLLATPTWSAVPFSDHVVHGRDDLPAERQQFKVVSCGEF